MIYIAPSLLAADFSRLGEESSSVIAAGANYLHFDVMDGLFVKNISFGLPVLEGLKKVVDASYDVHLMISNPYEYIDAFVAAGADIITFHYEACSDISKTISRIKSFGIKVGLSIKPETSAEVLLDYLPELDLVLIMTVEPGFGGQGFIESTLPKISYIKEEVTKRDIDLLIEVDGGINEITAKAVKACGANMLVAGSSIFRSSNYEEAIDKLRNA